MFYPERSTAAMRWRPAGALLLRGKARRGTAHGGSGSRGQWGDAWGGGEAGVGLRPAQSGGRAAYGTGGGKQRSRQEEEEKDWFANSENFRDPDVNQR